MNHKTSESPNTVAEWEALGQAKLAPGAAAYIAGAAADEISLRWNREAFDVCKLRVRVPWEAPPLHTEVEIFGAVLPSPIYLAPTAYHRVFHPDGEVATARGASLAGLPYCVSSGCTTPLDQIAAAATVPLWFQLYLAKDRGRARELVAMVQDVGVTALVLTVDTPAAGARDREKRANFQLPAGVEVPYWSHVRDEADASPNPVTWRDVEWLVAAARVPVCVKGVLDPDDAEIAADLGVRGVMVSNHGARNLDTVPSSLEALPAIVDRVGDRVVVTLDGGVRRGTDVLKAIAYGAQAVGVGRPYLYGLAAAGADGVAGVMKILQREFAIALALTGVRDINQLDGRVLWDSSK
jgi:4-hydroxymandelate oxidase